jgi:hypothetical protein
MNTGSTALWDTCQELVGIAQVTLGTRALDPQLVVPAQDPTFQKVPDPGPGTFCLTQVLFLIEQTCGLLQKSLYEVLRILENKFLVSEIDQDQ